MDKSLKNGSGYIDPTAYSAIKQVTEEEKKVSKVIKTLQAVARLTGYEIENRIVLRDKVSGRIWR